MERNGEAVDERVKEESRWQEEGRKGSVGI